MSSQLADMRARRCPPQAAIYEIARLGLQRRHVTPLTSKWVASSTYGPLHRPAGSEWPAYQDLIVDLEETGWTIAGITVPKDEYASVVNHVELRLSRRVS